MPNSISRTQTTAVIANAAAPIDATPRRDANGLLNIPGVFGDPSLYFGVAKLIQQTGGMSDVATVVPLEQQGFFLGPDSKTYAYLNVEDPKAQPPVREQVVVGYRLLDRGFEKGVGRYEQGLRVRPEGNVAAFLASLPLEEARGPGYVAATDFQFLGMKEQADGSYLARVRVDAPGDKGVVTLQLAVDDTYFQPKTVSAALPSTEFEHD